MLSYPPTVIEADGRILDSYFPFGEKPVHFRDCQEGTQFATETLWKDGGIFYKPRRLNSNKAEVVPSRAPLRLGLQACSIPGRIEPGARVPVGACFIALVVWLTHI